MTVRTLINKLSTLNPDLTVVLGIDESLEDICATGSETITVQFNEGGEKKNLFVLVPCYCHLDDDFDQEDESEINSKPELN